jgi:hypothetical protein
MQAFAMGQFKFVPVSASALPIWTLLYNETVAVHAYWKLFNQLFDGSQDQLELLNRSAGFCFFVIQDALATDIQLTLSKLSDAAESNGKTNATAEHLVDEIQSLRTDAPVDGLRGMLHSFIDACKPIRATRNKMIAHLDRATALQTGQLKGVPNTTVAQVNEALRALRNFMNAAAEYLGEVSTAYEHFITRGEGGDDLIALLRMAERYQVLQQEEKIPWDDLPND